LVAPNTSVTPEASSNMKVNAPENYNFNLDIESIDQFIILDDNVNNNNIKFNSNNSFVNNINNFNKYCDTDEPVTFESNVENYDTTSILYKYEYYVLTPDNEECLEVDLVMPVSLTNYNTDCNLDNDDNVNNIITNPITNRNVLFTDNE